MCFGYGRDDLIEIDGVVVGEYILTSIRKINVYSLFYIRIFNCGGCKDDRLTNTALLCLDHVTAGVKVRL